MVMREFLLPYVHPFAIVGFKVESVVKLIGITRLKSEHLQFEEVFSCKG